MPIRFNCPCGKQLQAKDNFAGRRMRCPSCGEILAIPGADAPALEPASVQPAAPITLEPVFDAPTLAPADSPPPVIPVDDETASVLPVVPVAAEPVEVVPVVPVVPEVDRSKSMREIENVWSTVSFDQHSVPWPADDDKRIGAVADKERGLAARLFVLFSILILLLGLAGAFWFFGGPS